MLLAWYCSIFHIEMTDRKTVRRDGAAAEWPNRYEGQFISEAVLRPSGSAQLGFHRSLTGFKDNDVLVHVILGIRPPARKTDRTDSQDRMDHPGRRISVKR
jgi:hypothetical protein